MGAGGSSPSDFSDFSAESPVGFSGSNRKSVSKADPGPFISDPDVGNRIGKLIPNHEGDRLGFQDLVSVKGALVEDHFAEPKVVGCRGTKTAST